MCYCANCDFDVEIEARDACYWLLAAGFPQYVQLYEGTPSIRLSALVIAACNSIFSCKQVKRAANITSAEKQAFDERLNKAVSRGPESHKYFCH